MRHWMAGAVAAAAVAGALGLGGCASVRGEYADARSYADSRSALAAATQGLAGKKQKKPRDRYLALQGLRNAVDGLAFLRLSHDLWQPFRIESSVGLYDPKWADEANLARMFLEADGRATDPLQYYGIGSEVTNGGLNIYAYAHTSGAALGSQFFPGITEADVAIEADADTLTFLARPHGVAQWTQLATHAFANQQIPLLPALGASNLDNGAKTGFDRFRVVANGLPTIPQSARQVLARQIWDAVAPQAKAYHELDGGAPDFPSAQADLNNAVALLDTARANSLLVDLGSIAQNNQLVAYFNQARTFLILARAQANKGKNAAAALNHLESAIENQGRAAGLCYPEFAPP